MVSRPFRFSYLRNFRDRRDIRRTTILFRRQSEKLSRCRQLRRRTSGFIPMAVVADSNEDVIKNFHGLFSHPMAVGRPAPLTALERPAKL